MQDLHSPLVLSTPADFLCTAVKTLHRARLGGKESNWEAKEATGRQRRHKARRQSRCSRLQQAHLKSKPPILVQHFCCIACEGIVSYIQVLDGAILKSCAAGLVHAGPPPWCSSLAGTWGEGEGEGGGRGSSKRWREAVSSLCADRSVASFSCSLSDRQTDRQTYTLSYTHAHITGFQAVAWNRQDSKFLKQQTHPQTRANCSLLCWPLSWPYMLHVVCMLL